MKEESDYFSYLLRFWLADDGEGPVWRASLESSQIGERHGFADVDDLCRHLQLLTNIESKESHDEINTL